MNRDRSARILLALAPLSLLSEVAPAQELLLRVDGRHAGQWMGQSPVGVGDVDGDGLDDIAYGIGGGTLVAVKSVLHPGTDMQLSPPVGVPQGSYPIRILGPGDVDGDGHDDIVVAYLLSTGDSGASLACFSGASGEALWITSARQPTLTLGEHMEATGDVDGDGIGDLLAVASSGNSGHPSEVAIVSGATGVRTTLLEPIGSVRHIARLGDLDGDGVGDFAIQRITGTSAPIEIYSAATGVLLRADGQPFSHMVSSPDVDGDGQRDILISLYNDSSVVENGGSARMLSGATGQVLWVRFGAWHDLFGTSLASLGDVDGDGTSDVAIGAINGGASPTNGDAHVLSGRTGETIYRVAQIPLLETLNVGDFVGCAGDVTGDGLPDLIVSDRYTFVHGANTGSVFVLTSGFDARRIDFEVGSDLAVELVNGQALDQSLALREWARVVGRGAASPGAALFDTTPAGPNAQSMDQDLLVDGGMALILQGDPLQSGPGVYAMPNDSAHGGVLRISLQGARRPTSLRLIDIDPGNSQDALVVLHDASRRRRSFHVPGGWTTDGIADITRASRALRLDTLESQPGVSAWASASEDMGFNLDAVLLIEVYLAGSGAVDDLVLFRP